MTENIRIATGLLVIGVLTLVFRPHIAYWNTRIMELFWRIITFGHYRLDFLHAQQSASGRLLLLGIGSICVSVFLFLVGFGVIPFGTAGGLR